MSKSQRIDELFENLTKSFNELENGLVGRKTDGVDGEFLYAVVQLLSKRYPKVPYDVIHDGLMP